MLQNRKEVVVDYLSVYVYVYMYIFVYLKTIAKS
jgi:hypothetical protein